MQVYLEFENQVDYMLAGKTATEWTKQNLSTLKSDMDFVLKLTHPAPLLGAKEIIRLAQMLYKKGLAKIIFDCGEMSLDQGVSSMRLSTLETSIVSEQNKNAIQKELYKKIAEYWQNKGVNILSTDTVFIDGFVQIAENCTIYPFSILKGHCYVGQNCCLVGSNYIENSTIGQNSKIFSSFIVDSSIGQNTTVGPFAQIRQNSTIGNNVRVGDFVEIKNSTLADGVKSAHLAYIGDATVGAGTNIGCGTVFANYDGKNKHKTHVGDNVFIGCNTNLVAPLKIGDNSFIAAGSTITQDLENNTFAIARQRQTNKKKKVE